MLETKLTIYPCHTREEAKAIARTLQAMVKMHLEIADALPSVHDLREAQPTLTGAMPTEQPEPPVDEPAEPPPAPKAKKKRAKKKAAPKPADDAPEVDFQKVREAVQDVIQKRGRDVAGNLIRSMGAEKVSGIPQEKWGDTITEARALLEED